MKKKVEAFMCNACGAIYIEDEFRAKNCCKESGMKGEGTATKVEVLL
jgi:hypothetical protein